MVNTVVLFTPTLSHQSKNRCLKSTLQYSFRHTSLYTPLLCHPISLCHQPPHHPHIPTSSHLHIPTISQTLHAPKMPTTSQSSRSSLKQLLHDAISRLKRFIRSPTTKETRRVKPCSRPVICTDQSFDEATGVVTLHRSW